MYLSSEELPTATLGGAWRHSPGCVDGLLGRQPSARVPAGVARVTAAHGQLPAAHLEGKQRRRICLVTSADSVHTDHARGAGPRMKREPLSSGKARAPRPAWGLLSR